MERIIGKTFAIGDNLIFVTDVKDDTVHYDAYKRDEDTKISLVANIEQFEVLVNMKPWVK